MKKILLCLTLLSVVFIISSCKKDKNTGPAVAYYPTDSLVAYFSFENNSINDTKGNTSAGTNHGSAAFGAGVHGNALTLNGVDQYLDFTTGPFASANGVSFSVWLKTDTFNSTTYFLRTDFYGAFTSYNTAGMAAFTPSTNSAYGSFHSQQWTHVVGTYDGTDIKLYVNGVLAQTVNWPGTLVTYNGSLTLGQSGIDFWKGSLDELFFYHKVLTQAEVTKLYNM